MTIELIPLNTPPAIQRRQLLSRMRSLSADDVEQALYRCEDYGVAAEVVLAVREQWYAQHELEMPAERPART